MRKHFCDVCGKEFLGETDADASFGDAPLGMSRNGTSSFFFIREIKDWSVREDETVKLPSKTYFTIKAHNKMNGENDMDICKYCVIDAIKALDDRKEK